MAVAEGRGAEHVDGAGLVAEVELLPVEEEGVDLAAGLELPQTAESLRRVVVRVVHADALVRRGREQQRERVAEPQAQHVAGMKAEHPVHLGLLKVPQRHDAVLRARGQQPVQPRQVHAGDLAVPVPARQNTRHLQVVLIVVHPDRRVEAPRDQ